MKYHEALGLKIDLEQQITTAKYQRHALLNNLGVQLMQSADKQEPADYKQARALLNGAEAADNTVYELSQTLQKTLAHLPK